MNTIIAKIAIILSIGLSATACTNMKDQPKSIETTAPLPVISQLAKASDTAAFSLALLSRIESTRTPIKPATADGLMPDILKKRVTITWTGPLDGLVRKLATLSNYDFSIIGKPPISPVIISIAAQDKALIEVFRTIGQQAGTRALVTINAQQSKVEVFYDN